MICSSTYPCIHWLTLVGALTGDQTLNPNVSGPHSSQLNYLASVNCPKFGYIHRIKHFASVIKITKETIVSWNAHMLLMKKGTDYYVVYIVTYIKENERIFVLYYFLHNNLGVDK